MRNKAEIVTRTKAAPRHAGYKVDLHPVQENCCTDFAPFLHWDCCGNGAYLGVPFRTGAWAARGGDFTPFFLRLIVRTAYGRNRQLNRFVNMPR